MTGPAYGPERIAVGEAPGGIVTHSYGSSDGRLLHTSNVTDLDTIACQAVADTQEVAAALAAGETSILVLYDGDSGERLP